MDFSQQNLRASFRLAPAPWQETAGEHALLTRHASPPENHETMPSQLSASLDEHFAGDAPQSRRSVNPLLAVITAEPAGLAGYASRK